MSVRRFFPFVLVPSLLLLVVVSCNDDWLRSEYDTTVQWDGAYKGPLVYGSLKIKDLLETYDSTGYVSEDSTGLLYGAYSRDTVLSAPEILQLPDQQFLQVFFRVDSTIPGAFLGPVGDTIQFSQDKGFKFKRTGEERLDSVHVKTGEMRIYVRSTIRHEGILTIRSDNVILNGRTYNEVIVISDPSGNFEQTVNIPMDGATVRLDNSVPDSSSLDILFLFDLINSGNDILSSEEVEIINSFHDLEFSAAFGYIPFDSLLIDRAELDFSLLEGNFEGTIKLANPQLNIRTDNSIGIPFGIELLDLEANFKDGSGTVITIDPGANPIRIAAPSIDQVGESVKDSSHIDNTNSDIHLAATSDLVGFQYSVRAIANPDGPQANFILENSQMGINIEGLVPLDLRIQDVVLGDTFDFELTEDEDADFSSDDVKYIKVRMETDNSMPIDLGIQVYFIDSTQNWVRLDSLFGTDRDVFRSGILNAEGRVIQATNKVTEVELTRSQIDHILDANKMLLKAYVETTDGGTKDVKFYSDYSLDFKLGTHLELSLTLESDENDE